MSKKLSRSIITIGALAVIVARHLWPQLQIDTTDFVLIVILFLPWLSDLIKEVEVPGFGKIGFQDVKAAGEKIGLSAASSFSSTDIQETDAAIVTPSNANANILFVILRIQIEKRLRQLAEQNNVPNTLSLNRLVSELVHREILRPSMGNGLIDLIHIGNQAAYGARVDANAALWAKENSDKIIESLDKVISRAG
jgi:hypothetical protein